MVISYVDNMSKQVVIVGGGLVGALNACFMAKRGYKVDVFEKREDIRQKGNVTGRSINLSLSERGSEALRQVGLEESVTEQGIPMYGRMIHGLDKSQFPIPYGKDNQCIVSINRKELNEILLTAAEKYSNVTIHFDHTFVCSDFMTGEVEFERSDGSHVKFSADLVIGSDGAHSAVRRQMMQTTQMNYQQEYITHGYMELHIPPIKTDKGPFKFAMRNNYLHIWPRSEFVMVGLPNRDKSFTITLVMPFHMFSALSTEDDILKFFEETFPDAVPLIGASELVRTYLKGKASPLVSIKCSPYHVGGKTLIIGDAAHAMTPFYGQGMNAGFEDCIILNDLLDKHCDNFDAALKEFTEFRTRDAHAMNDLAMDHYIELRKSVISRSFFLRKTLDNALHLLFPSTWVPLYTMVTFTRIRYHLCIARRKWQDEILTKTLYLSGAALILGSTLGLKFLMSQPTVTGLQKVMVATRNCVSGLFTD